jgi:hypothetical protein
MAPGESCIGGSAVIASLTVPLTPELLTSTSDLRRGSLCAIGEPTIRKHSERTGAIGTDEKPDLWEVSTVVVAVVAAAAVAAAASCSAFHSFH